MNDRKNGVTVIGVGTPVLLGHILMPRLPTAADDFYNADSIWFFRIKNIHRQGDAFGAMVNDIPFAGHLSLKKLRRAKQNGEKGEQFYH